MKRVALYVRVSTEEQRKHGISVDNQIDALRDYCKANKYKEAGLYNDAGISARKRYTKRPALLQLLEDVKQGKIDMLLFTKLDRFFRSVADYYEVMAILDAHKVPWRAIWEDYETETSAGVFKVNIMLSVAQAEADRTSERLKATFEYKRARNEFVGLPPYGYKVVDKRLVYDEELYPIVRKAFDIYLSSHSTAEVLSYLERVGHRASRHRVSRMLFGGHHSGNVNGIECEPYITKEEEKEILRVRDSHYRAPKKTHEYLFSGICYCGECGYKLRSMASGGRKGESGGKRYNTYGCRPRDHATGTIHTNYCSESIIERYLLSQIENLISDFNANMSYKSVSKYDYEAEIKKLEEKLRRVGVRYEDGDLSDIEYRAKRNEIKEQIAQLEKPVEVKEIALPVDWKEAYSSLDMTHKRQFWYSIIKKITINLDNTIEVEFL